jgi:ABC-type amino acid transport substrate-binding protein
MKAEFPDVKVNTYDTSNNMFLDLLAGRIDLGITGLIPAKEWMDKTPEAKGYGIIGKPITDEKYIGKGFAMALRKQDTELLKKFNDALATIIANGTHKKISSKYFDIDMYDYNK